MRTKAGFLVVLSSLLLFSACAEVKTNSMVSQKTPNSMVGQWAYVGSVSLPGCDGVVNGVMSIAKDGSVDFVEGDSSTCVRGAWSITTHAGRGTMRILKPENNRDIFQVIFTNNGPQSVKIIPIHGIEHPRMIRLLSVFSGGIFKAVAIHL